MQQKHQFNKKLGTYTPTMTKLNSIWTAMIAHVINNYYCKLYHLIPAENIEKYLCKWKYFPCDTLIDPTMSNKIKKLFLFIKSRFI